MSESEKKAVSADATKVVEIALRQVAGKMEDLINQTMMIYLWKWYPPSRPLQGKMLSDFLIAHGCGWSVVDKTTDQISGVTSIIYAFSRPKQKVYKAARLDFRAVNPDIHKEQLLLEFGHVEIPFPADIKVVVD